MGKLDQHHFAKQSEILKKNKELFNESMRKRVVKMENLRQLQSSQPTFSREILRKKHDQNLKEGVFLREKELKKDFKEILQEQEREGLKNDQL